MFNSMFLNYYDFDSEVQTDIPTACNKYLEYQFSRRRENRVALGRAYLEQRYLLVMVGST